MKRAEHNKVRMKSKEFLDDGSLRGMSSSLLLPCGSNLALTFSFCIETWFDYGSIA